MKTQFMKFTLAASIGLALAFTFSCSSDDDGGGEQPSSSSGTEVSSSSSGGGGGSSSSNGTEVSSSSSGGGGENVVYGSPVTYEGKTYKTVVIGTQTWMAENLDYAVEGSTCYNNQESYCNTYGRLYGFATVMALPSKCNSYSSKNDEECAIQTPNHQGICPSGWHLPTRDEWNALSKYIKSENDCKDCVAKHLKAKSGWNENGNGLDTYGFSALPGGGHPDFYFNYTAGDFGGWWAGERITVLSPYTWILAYDFDGASWANDNPFSLLSSVRCVKDSGGGSSSSNGAGGSSSSNGGSSSSIEVVYGSPVTYEGKTYKTVVIDTQTWMAENLDYDPGEGNSACYGNYPGSCTTYGRLYDWSTAMALPSSCNHASCLISSPHRGICPSGWHIPSNEDWDKLMRYVDGTSGTDSPYSSPTAGRYLKAASMGGEDTYGFSALPGGSGSDGYFSSVVFYGDWWSTSEDSFLSVYGRRMYYLDEGALSIYGDKSFLFSVRCVKD